MIDELSDSFVRIVQATQANTTLLLWIVGLPWLTFFITKITRNRLLCLGIIPRQWFGLPGIIFCPFLHADFNHLFFNSIPLLVLSDFVLLDGFHYFLMASILITLLSGLLVWLFGKPGVHIGASGLITGYWALVVANGYQEATLTSIVLGLLSLYYFAGIFFGIFPQKKGVSWEGHLFGLMAGLVASYFLQPQ